MEELEIPQIDREELQRETEELRPAIARLQQERDSMQQKLDMLRKNRAIQENAEEEKSSRTPTSRNTGHRSKRMSIASSNPSLMANPKM